jgi:hypothetical protein
VISQFPFSAACAAANEEGALTNALNQALVCLARTLSARPVGACFKRCLASEITSFDSDSSRSRKLCCCFDLHHENFLPTRILFTRHSKIDKDFFAPRQNYFA